MAEPSNPQSSPQKSSAKKPSYSNQQKYKHASPAKGGIPFIIGITGHRDLSNEDIPSLERLIRSHLTYWMNRYPHTEFICMTSLAEGADQLCGRIASDLGMPLLVPLPLQQGEYEKDFSDQSLVEFRELIGKATSVFVAPDTEGLGNASREYGYRQAGIYIARHCHVLLALWDGSAGMIGGCGTSETVDFKMKHAYRAPDTLLITPNEGIVLHVVTPRSTNNVPLKNALSIQLIESTTGALDKLLNDTNTFNKDSIRVDVSKSSGAFDIETMNELDPTAEKLNKLYRIADTLALRYRDQYLRMLKWLCATGALLVLAFLFYDELEANLFLIAYGAIALIAFVVFLIAKYGCYHDKYIEYRLFAETLRVQLNLLVADLNLNAEDLIPWSQRTISPWIGKAMYSLPGSESIKSGTTANVREVWILDQLHYQKMTLEKNEVKLNHQRTISNILVASTVLFFLAVLVLEFQFPLWIGSILALPGRLSKPMLMHSSDFFSTRSIFNILLGIIPALSFTVTSYYGKLSLERKIKDGQRMIALYSEAAEAYNNTLIDRAKLFTELAREELVEAGNWYSYTSENQPDILI